jgi:hypothetical protein
LFWCGFAVLAAELIQIGPPPLAVIAKERRAAAALKLKFFSFQATTKLAASRRSQSSNASLFSYLRQRLTIGGVSQRTGKLSLLSFLSITLRFLSLPTSWCEAAVCTASAGQLHPWHGCPQILFMLDAAYLLILGLSQSLLLVHGRSPPLKPEIPPRRFGVHLFAGSWHRLPNLANLASGERNGRTY